VEEKMAGLDAEIAAIRKQVEEDMRSDEARNRALIDEETARIVAAAEQEIAVAATRAQHGLKKFAADLAIDRAVSQLTVNAETDRVLFAEFAADVAGGHGKRRAKGGQS
jgi:F-type H+-transporting ATPase subunit b